MTDKGLSIVGSSRANGEREENDFYPTPASAVYPLLEREVFSGNIWECACGDGAISKVLEKKEYKVISTDLIDRGYGKGQVNFLANGMFSDLEQQDNIITNPPYKYALEFVLQAKKLARYKIAMFLKTVFLESQVRYDMFQDRIFPLKTMYQFSNRVPIYKSGIVMKNSGLVAYAWFVWERGYNGKPTIEWINKMNNVASF